MIDYSASNDWKWVQFLIFKDLHVIYMNVLACLPLCSMCTQCLQGPEEGTASLELELHTGSYEPPDMSAGN